MAILPALAIVPASAWLVFAPRTPERAVVILSSWIAVAEFVRISKLVRGGVERPFNLLSPLSFGAILVVVVIPSYTGMFVAVLAQRM